MLFSVIYSADVPSSEDIGRYMPARPVRRLMRKTEGNEGYEYGYLADEAVKGSIHYSRVHRWAHGKHRKLIAIFTKRQFETFISQVGLTCTQDKTCGMLGGAHGYGWLPALNFRLDAEDYEDVIGSCYVCPLPELPLRAEGQRLEDVPFTDDDWRRVEAATIAVYGSHGSFWWR